MHGYTSAELLLSQEINKVCHCKKSSSVSIFWKWKNVVEHFVNSRSLNWRLCLHLPSKYTIGKYKSTQIQKCFWGICECLLLELLLEWLGSAYIFPLVIHFLVLFGTAWHFLGIAWCFWYCMVLKSPAYIFPLVIHFLSFPPQQNPRNCKVFNNLHIIVVQKNPKNENFLINHSHPRNVHCELREHIALIYFPIQARRHRCFCQIVYSHEGPRAKRKPLRCAPASFVIPSVQMNAGNERTPTSLYALPTALGWVFNASRKGSDKEHFFCFEITKNPQKYLILSTATTPKGNQMQTNAGPRSTGRVIHMSVFALVCVGKRKYNF